MELTGITWMGGPVDDDVLLATLPAALRSLLEVVNGFILFSGALHVRGAVREPSWHSLRRYWSGETAVGKLYTGVRSTDVPFAQDCVGDQFLIRDGTVWRLDAETGAVENLRVGLEQFLVAACGDPVGVLSAEPLVAFRSDGSELAPGHVLLAYPPYCTEQAAGGVSLKALPANDVLSFHAQFAAGIAGVPDGGKLQIVLTD